MNNDDDTQKLPDISKLVATLTEGDWHAPKGDQRYEAPKADDSGWDGEALATEIVRDRMALADAVGLTAGDVLNEDIEVITERIAEIIAERDALKAALKPFAAAGADLDDYDADNSVLHMEFTHGYWPVHFGLDDAEPLTVEHLKAAARALKAEDTDGA